MSVTRTEGSAPSTITLRGPFTLESGDVLPSLTIAFHTWGKRSPAGDNAVVVCHALTGSSDAAQWWPALIGPGRALDPCEDYIVCANVLGGCYGTTGPSSLASDGRPWGARFPRVTVRDIVRAQQRLLDALGVTRVRLVIGGSLGGMQALEWALLDSGVERAAIIAAPAQHDAWAIAWSDAQRRVLAAVPHDDEFGHRAGLAAARAIAMISYRHPDSFAKRFARTVGEDPTSRCRTGSARTATSSPRASTGTRTSGCSRPWTRTTSAAAAAARNARCARSTSPRSSCR
jgi:homoserine O-acetyltransferase